MLQIPIRYIHFYIDLFPTQQIVQNSTDTMLEGQRSLNSTYNRPGASTEVEVDATCVQFGSWGKNSTFKEERIPPDI